MASARTWEERPAIDAAMEDPDEFRLRRHFRHRFPGWTAPDDWRETLIAHKLAVEVENRVLPTCVGILLLAEQPERLFPAAYVDLALYTFCGAAGASPVSGRSSRRLIESAFPLREASFDSVHESIVRQGEASR